VELPTALAAALEMAFNQYLHLDPEAGERLRALHGRVIAIEIVGFDLRLFLIPGAAGVQVLGRCEGAADCTLRGTPLGLMRIGMVPDKTRELFAGGVEIDGDTHLGQRFGQILGDLRIDWEDLLSRITGDVVAHAAGQGVRAFAGWAWEAAQRLTEDLQQYLQEESRLAPTRYEVDEFLAEVDRLRDDAERLATRIERLRRGHGEDHAQNCP
jgi:ubiquinone biosynthesis accessory factor UbiJ